jgi:pyrroline-5-carboxylate reductase
MDQVEALETEHPKAAARQVVQGRASHATDSQDDHVVARHQVVSPSGLFRG